MNKGQLGGGRRKKKKRGFHKTEKKYIDWCLQPRNFFSPS